MRQRLVRIAGMLFGLGLFALAAIVLSRQLGAYRMGDILNAFGRIPPERLILGLAFSASCYLALTFYDTLACRYLKIRLPWRKIARASFVGYAFSHNVGLTIVTSAPMKYRFYSAWGIGAKKLAGIVAFCGLTFWTGFATLMGLSLALAPDAIPKAVGMPAIVLRPLGAILIALVVFYLVASGARRRPLKIWKWEIAIPPSRIALSQIAASSLEWTSAAAVLYTMFYPLIGIGFPAFLAIFLFAYVSGFASQVPGGLGVFETVVLVSVGGFAPAPTIMGALLAYRAIYYIVPLAAATVVLGIHELSRRQRRHKKGP